MKKSLALSLLALLSTTFIWVANAQDGDATAPTSFMLGDARYAVEAQFEVIRDAAGNQALQVSAGPGPKIAPFFVESRKPATATVFVDGKEVLKATDQNGVVRGTIPESDYAGWIGASHDFRIEVKDAGGEMLLQRTLNSGLFGY